MSKSPDEIDLRIIETLREDGRTPNKSIARSLNVSETTIAARIRALTERNVMQVTLQRDIYALGYEFHVICDIYVAGRPVEDVAAEIAAKQGVLGVGIYLGNPDLHVWFGARDRHDLAGIVHGHLDVVPGIQRVESYIVAKFAKYESTIAALGKDRVAN